MHSRTSALLLVGHDTCCYRHGEPCQAQLFGGGGCWVVAEEDVYLGVVVSAEVELVVADRLLGGGGFGGGRPMLGGGAPIMRPSRPIIRQPIVRQPIIRQPIARPTPARPVLGGGGARPILGGRPAVGASPLPSRPGLGNGPIVGRPGAGPLPGRDRPILGDRPVAGNLPSVDRLPAINPPKLPGVVRPGQPVNRDRLNDFLSGADRPAAGQLPAGPGDRPPLLGDRPGIGGDRPVIADRPILELPIMPNLGEQILREDIRNEIVARRVERAAQVRDRIRELYYRENHPFVYWWHYMWTNHPVWSWWRVTAPYRWADWSSVSSWCGYSGSYAQPVTYEYTDDGTYANGQEVTVDDEYSKQARELAAAGAQLLQQKIDAQEADKLEWLPLGVFALCKSEDGDPTMFLQLAISREGIVAGSFANTTNNENLSVQGGADRESTRLAVTIGDQDDVVVETGLYNVTEQQSSALVHYQDGTRENWLLVKMPDPQGKQDK